VGAEIYNGLAMAVVGGLPVATLFTPEFVPIVYTMVASTMNRLREILRISD
jgi:hydrophobic/amphiphilic exporter-1 (mainly G- bacteria), HAE1 family